MSVRPRHRPNHHASREGLSALWNTTDGLSSSWASADVLWVLKVRREYHLALPLQDPSNIKWRVSECTLISFGLCSLPRSPRFHAILKRRKSKRQEKLWSIYNNRIFILKALLWYPFLISLFQMLLRWWSGTNFLNSLITRNRTES